MRASERLEALEKGLMTYQAPGDKDREVALLTALPAILEVVKAAEKFERSALHWTEDRHHHKAIRAALTALNEKLL